MSELGPREQALARSRLYGLLARLLVRGVERPLLEQIAALGWAESDASLDELAAEHHASFALGVFPYAGVFLDASASAGACSDLVRSFYARAGFNPILDELTADHLGVELSFLSFVTGAQAEALEDGRPQIAAALDPLLAEFLDACVLSYLPAMVCAIEQLPDAGSWATIIREALLLLAEHRARLPGPIVPVALIDPGDLLADERTGLRRIAEHLLTPAASGVFASRADIAAWGRGRSLPRGFGARVVMLDNLLRSAVEYGELASLLAALDAHLEARDHALAGLARACELEPAVAPWREALARTRTLLARLASKVHSPDQAGSPWTSKPSTTPPPAP
ncbi:MAG: molecular chaperone TorD family protein [Enhygromyxa sp.]